MGTRDFNDSTKLEVIRKNMEKNKGDIVCETCNKKLVSIKECHFDHIYPFSKGGKLSVDNCQILCIECNLKKNDKMIENFVLEERAKAFLAGMEIEENKDVVYKNIQEDDDKTKDVISLTNLTKEEFDVIIQGFIDKYGDIKKIDFAREYNHLPSFSYVTKYYGGLIQLKEAFNISDISFSWDREKIYKALNDFVKKNGRLNQKDMKKNNGLPSITCILRYYPEYKSLTDVQRELLGLDTAINWDRDSAVVAGKKFLETHSQITQKDFKSTNGLPSYSVIMKLFKSLNEFQNLVGAPISKRNEFITKNEIHCEVDNFFGKQKKEIINQVSFQESFPVKLDIIRKRYGSFDRFCEEEGISVLKKKVFRYSKQDVDEAISNWISEGNDIPKVHDLSKQGLPSQAVILKYYEDWKEPFVLYKKLHEKLNGKK